MFPHFNITLNCSIMFPAVPATGPEFVASPTYIGSVHRDLVRAPSGITKVFWNKWLQFHFKKIARVLLFNGRIIYYLFFRIKLLMLHFCGLVFFFKLLLHYLLFYAVLCFVFFQFLDSFKYLSKWINWTTTIITITVINTFFLWCYSPTLALGLPPWNSPFHFRSCIVS